MSPGTGRLTVIAAGALVAGLLPAAGSAAEEGAVSVSAGYVCEGAGGTAVDLPVDFTGSFPASVRSGEAIRPGDLTMSATLGGGLLDGLPAGEGATVGGSASVAMGVAQGPESADYPWAGATGEPVQVPADGTATVSFSGAMPSATAGGAGDVVFTLGPLTLELQGTPPEPGDDSSPPADPADPAADPADQDDPADPAGPGATTLTCTLADGQDATLATVAVPDESGTPGGGDAGADDGGAGQGTPGATGGRSGSAGADAEAAPGDEPAETGDVTPCPPGQPPTAELDPDRLIEPPAGTTTLTLPGVYTCTAAVGIVNSRKLNGALIANDPHAPTLDSVRVLLNKQMIISPGNFYNGTRNVAEFTLPDSEATFLTFGFMPVTGKVEFTNEPMTIVTEQGSSIDTNETTAGFYQALRVYDVKVNGVPLDVGDDCRTSAPLDVVLKGKYPEYRVFTGGTLRSLVTVPPFTGCGTGGEDLDPLFTSTLSGPGNYVELKQSPLCTMPCTPAVPGLPADG
ncbi:DUF6801 domain-containing protein [Streptomyces sp. B22F1]|uniref:DUF6801 domain-containing protein n=1 Tax=Streptomyces sp. B22F1 TaxID=3153566 RepID=UPI00119943E9